MTGGQGTDGAADFDFAATGAPGLRREYHGNHYGAFVLDPDRNTEAVCHRQG